MSQTVAVSRKKTGNFENFENLYKNLYESVKKTNAKEKTRINFKVDIRKREIMTNMN